MKPPLALFALLLASTPLLGGAPVDGLGDPIPGGAVARLGTVRFRHGETPTALAWSPDGKRLITTAGSVVSLFDPEGRRAAAWELPAEEGWALEALAWSPDGKTVAVAGSVPVVVLLDPHSGARQTFATASEGGEPAVALAWSPDGKQLVTLCGGKAQVRTPEGALVRELAPAQGALEVLAWSPDGKRLVAGGTETGLLLLDPLSGAIGPAARAPQKTAEEEDEEQEPATVSALAFSPDGSILAAGDGDEVCLISAAGEELARLELSELGGLRALGFSPDGKTLACGGQARLALVDVAARREQGSLPRRVEALVFSPDGKTLLGAGWETALFALDVGAGKVRPAPGHWGDVRALAWLPSGRALLSAGTDGQVLSWDPAARTSTTLIHGPDAPTALAASPTGELCAVGDAEGIVLHPDVYAPFLTERRAVLVTGVESLCPGIGRRWLDTQEQVAEGLAAARVANLLNSELASISAPWVEVVDVAGFPATPRLRARGEVVLVLSDGRRVQWGRTERNLSDVTREDPYEAKRDRLVDLLEARPAGDRRELDVRYPLSPRAPR